MTGNSTQSDHDVYDIFAMPTALLVTVADDEVVRP